ncbi:hypothetical protein SAMN05421505_11655 [Sinosporangium album]|uniref:Uncharacterized protein n=1 Tax=Sinosporangium album TaxID=504805 RepID=A0A1G8CL72_9ACTN|nr:hypothetical protein SAMN05421505_11655 [Sinosporangium album]
MTAGAATAGAATLFNGLVDDAGLFPPAALPMGEALARHERDLAAGSPVLTHVFLCPASRIGELGGAPPKSIGLIVDKGALPDLAGLGVVSIDIPGEGTEPVVGACLATGLPVYVEPTRSAPGWLEAVARLPLTPGLSAKVRCGGVTAELFPTPAELGAFIAICVEGDLPFKATAGLHHAVRRYDPVLDVYRHGFLNLLLATCVAVEGGDPVAVLESAEADELVRLARAVPEETASRARRLLVSYGSCSTSTPIEDLRALGLIEEENG